MQPEKTTIVIADDHQIFRQGLRQLLAESDEIEIIAESNNGDDLLNLIFDLKPDVAVMDISMPGPGPEGVLKAVDQSDSRTKIMALSMHLEPSFAKQMLALGMCAYVVKDAAFDELVFAIKAVIEGQRYLCKTLRQETEGTELPPLTEREHECLRAAAEGLTAKMIAKQLNISERTVRFHFANVCRKYGVNRRSEAVAEAVRSGVILLT